MTSIPLTSQPESRLPHRLAALLIATTFPLIFVGGLVTTTEAGMAVPDWPTTYGYNLFLYPWQTWLWGPWDLFIEHGHRLLGALVGMLSIALAAVVWRCDARRWMRWLAVAALGAVIVQGCLGGLRVVLNERGLAQLHGCIGPAFFSLTVALAVFTSPLWRSSQPREPHAYASRLQRLAVLTALLAYLQLIVGSQLRHMPAAASPELFRAAVLFHLVLAAVVAVHAVLLAFRVVRHHRAVAPLRRPAWALLALVAIQLGLGGATWVAKYAWPSSLSGYSWAAGHTVIADGMLQTNIVTAHVACGSLIVAVALVLSLRAFRLLAPVTAAERTACEPVRRGPLAMQIALPRAVSLSPEGPA